MFLKKSSIGQFSASIANPFQSQFGTFKQGLERLAGDIRDEVALLSSQVQTDEAVQNSRFRAAMTKFSHSVSQQQEQSLALRRRGAKLQFLDACSTYNYEQAWKGARKRGTTRWICEKKEYTEWRSQKQYGVLWCSGILGSGKTVLSANVVEDLILDPAVDTVGYFFCRHDDIESLKATTILGCLVRQVYTGLGGDVTEKMVQQGMTKLDVDQLLSYLREVPTSPSRMHFVIDGIDECEAKEVSILFDCLKQLAISKHTFLVLCTSRPDMFPSVPELATAQWHLSMSQGGSENDDEIARYIQSELEYRIDQGIFSPSDHTIIPSIVEALLLGAQGM